MLKYNIINLAKAAIINMYKVNPRVDLAFKKIFGVEENKDLLISVINSYEITELSI